MFRRHDDPQLSAARADVDALLQRLGRDVTSLSDNGDPLCRQALFDASERYQTAADQFARARSVAELLVVRSIAVEGLQSTRTVRTRQGLDPGPDPTPAPAPSAPAEVHHAWTRQLRSGGLGSAVGAGAAGGLLGVLGGAMLGEAFGGEREGWGYDDGDGGGDFGGGDFGD